MLLIELQNCCKEVMSLARKEEIRMSIPMLAFKFVQKLGLLSSHNQGLEIKKHIMSASTDF
jgi:hypothetical protein